MTTDTSPCGCLWEMGEHRAFTRLLAVSLRCREAHSNLPGTRRRGRYPATRGGTEAYTASILRRGGW